MRSTLLTCALAGLSAVDAISTISAKGAKFFTSDGNQFFVRGVAYQLVPEDPLIDDTQCKLDSALMQKLGVNSIRVYHVDANGKHDDCMKTFEDAGIYVWLDLDDFDSQIEQIAPHWNQTQVTSFQKVMDAFANYDNVAGFFVGNEVVTTENGTVAAPFVKAAGRDLKAYRDSKGYRKIPIGYSAADIAYNRPMLQNYFACGDNASEALDFFGLNTYSWCGDSSYSQSGYDQRVEEAKILNIPIFITETGCRQPQPRNFQDQSAIFGEMASVYNGAIIYEWIEETNDYGLITYGEKVDPAASGAPPDGYTRSGTPTPKNPDFTNLSNQWKTLTASSIKEADYKPSISAPACPSYQSASGSQWQVSGNVALPTVGQTYNAQQATQTGGGNNAGPTGTAANPSASATKGAAAGSPVREVQGMGIGLVGVLVGFFWWM
ncbi:glycoside hydrolase family 72 protein [Lophiostoma macrostomum CBS 122681]|uniref:1,3-beta-glucanosyltransferase n=1 Tax=Lophiostoma macrostomum CBS 122681 TaxID=1314788 RepID=A0A6A6T1I2_9PLEO|nr:glycoside hydrolase family 72 protein [Lophiostoma macrostomum CBS 122681]